MNKAFLSLLLLSLYLSFAAAFSEEELAPGPEPTFSEEELAPGPAPENEVQVPTKLNPRLERAYKALQAIKRTVKSDPQKLMENWVGPDVCVYTGVTCSPSLDDPSMTVVAGLDLNGGDIAASLPPEIELLVELGFLHINSNRFCGIVPAGIRNLPLLYELDLSNNRFVGPFPKALLEMPGLKYLDIRFNNFEGPLPAKLFELEMDAIFVNNNRFTGSIPDTLGKSPVSVVVFAHNKLSGCIPASIGNMTHLEQILFSDNNLTGCLPEEMGHLASVEALDLSDNSFKGDVPDSICELPKLSNFSFANNYFVKAGAYCYSPVKDMGINDTANCMEGLPNQKPESMCSLAVDANGAIDCSQCRATPATSAPSIAFSPNPQPIQAQPAPSPRTVESPPPLPYAYAPNYQARKLARPAFEDVRSLHTFRMF